jgi:prepilin-type N-terminal cleavage/methylation domain-containing protein
MKAISARFSTEVRRGGFTLPELMIALGVGLPLAGAVVLLLLQASFEQRYGLADTTVEESAYVLQARITSCLRSMSSSEGLTPDYSSGVYDDNGTLLGYQTVYVFHANTDGSYTREQISFNPNLGQVVYTPDVSAPANQIVWMTNSPTVALTILCFNTFSPNPDGSMDSSLVNARFHMDDNGYSQQNLTNSPASIERSFSVQMRSD